MTLAATDYCKRNSSIDERISSLEKRIKEKKNWK